MEAQKFIEAVKSKKLGVFMFIVVFLLFSIVFSVIQPFKFGAESKLLVIQDFPVGMDPYLAVKSNQHLSNVLANITATNSFYEQVISSDKSIDASYFQGTRKEQMKKWNQTIRAEALADTGLIKIGVYHKDRGQADLISRKTSEVLAASHAQYHGAGEKVQIKIVDPAITSNYPVKPNLIANILVGLVAGAVFGLIYVYLFPESKSRRKYL